MEKLKVAIKEEWDEMLKSHVMPMFEIEIVGGNYLIVNLELTDKGIEFTFDQDGKPEHFDGETVKLRDGKYLIPFDRCFDKLDTYLEYIMADIKEGFIIPNNLYCENS